MDEDFTYVGPIEVLKIRPVGKLTGMVGGILVLPKEKVTIVIPFNDNAKLEEVREQYNRPSLKGGDSFEHNGIIYTVLEDVD